MSFVGKYERVSAERYDEFLEALGVSSVLRKAASASTPVMTVKEEDGVWTIKTSTTLKTMKLKFELGKEFEEKTPDGRDVKSIVTQEDNKFIAVQTAIKEGVPSTKSVREFNGDEVVQTLEIIGKDISCIQVFKRIE